MEKQFKLEDMAKDIEKLRTDYLFGLEEQEDKLSPKATAHFMQSLALLDAASRSAALAQIEQK